MAKKGFTPEQIISKLREAEVLLSQGAGQSPVSVHYLKWLKCPTFADHIQSTDIQTYWEVSIQSSMKNIGLQSSY